MQIEKVWYFCLLVGSGTKIIYLFSWWNSTTAYTVICNVYLCCQPCIHVLSATPLTAYPVARDFKICSSLRKAILVRKEKRFGWDVNRPFAVLIAELGFCSSHFSFGSSCIIAKNGVSMCHLSAAGSVCGVNVGVTLVRNVYVTVHSVPADRFRKRHRSRMSQNRLHSPDNFRKTKLYTWLEVLLRIRFMDGREFSNFTLFM